VVFVAMIPDTPFSSHTARMAFSSAPDRSGEIFTTSGFGAVPASLPMACSNSESFSGSCNSRKPGVFGELIFNVM
jgi:hypothetical protein